MITRKEYLSGEASHNAYHRQFVTPGIKKMVETSIGKERIRKSVDPNFNDIPLKEWDTLSNFLGPSTNTKLKECGDYLTLSTAVCILKEAARQLKEGVA